MTRSSILVVEDDVAIRRGLVHALGRAGFDVTEAGDGVRGRELATGSSFDLVLLDLVLPAESGLEVLAAIRRRHPTLPVIIVTARGEESQRVEGLQLGADDYVVKPFGARELVARIEAVLRRSPERPHPVETIPLPGGVVDLRRQEVRSAAGGRVELTSLEAGLLRYLAERPGRVVSRRELLERLWGARARVIATRSVDMTVARVRKKLGDDGPALLVTVRGKGYKIVP